MANTRDSWKKKRLGIVGLQLSADHEELVCYFYLGSLHIIKALTETSVRGHWCVTPRLYVGIDKFVSKLTGRDTCPCLNAFIFVKFYVILSLPSVEE